MSSLSVGAAAELQRRGGGGRMGGCVVSAGGVQCSEVGDQELAGVCFGGGVYY